MRLESNQQCLSGGGFTVHWGYQFSYTSINLVPPTRIELVMTGYQPIVIPFNYRGIIWWRLEESNYLANHPT